jgi:hypothetical protein
MGSLQMRQSRTIRSFRSALRVASLTAALAGIVLLATGAAWWHVDNPGSVDTCPICCHIAHISALPGTLAAAIAAPLLVEWLLTAERLVFEGAPSVLVPPSRAPPRLA